MTPEEDLLWRHLRGSKLGGFHFRRQQIIDGFIVDFYCHSVGLVVEIDGEIHQEQVEEDSAREQILLDRGLRILRFPNQDIRNNISVVLKQILSACSPLPFREGAGG